MLLIVVVHIVHANSRYLRLVGPFLRVTVGSYKNVTKNMEIVHPVLVPANKRVFAASAYLSSFRSLQDGEDFARSVGDAARHDQDGRR